MSLIENMAIIEAWVWSPERSGGNLEAKFTEFSIAQYNLPVESTP